MDRDELQRIGLTTARLEETPGHPIVYGEWLGAAGAPTMLFYGHYDVQPVDPLESVGLAALRGDRPRRRDLRARRGRRQGPDLHALQGHRGSPAAVRAAAGQHQGRARGRGRSRQRATSTTTSAVTRRSSPRTSSSSPTRRCSIAACRRSATGLRGLAYYQIDVRGTTSDLHSGSFGGAVANPAFVLAQILAQAKDRSGRIKIPGFYDKVRELTARGARRVRAPAVQREEISQGARRAEAVRRVRLHHARARLGAADLRGQRAAVRVHRRGRQDRDSGGRDGQGQHAPGARSGFEGDRQAVRSVDGQGVTEDRGRQAHAHARWQAVDDELRQSVRSGGGAGDRKGIRRTSGA